MTLGNILANGDERNIRRMKQERLHDRYSQLLELMKIENYNFSMSKYWQYGCHCIFYGEKAVQAMGYGKPRDQLDRYSNRNSA